MSGYVYLRDDDDRPDAALVSPGSIEKFRKLCPDIPAYPFHFTGESEYWLIKFKERH